ncbi:uncharacterized protein J4E78_008246 [Alternaria triticimaculans]|uniref:uncharacterized protein n=1 Tax=Alternaria triticimaculans TaxID=297637 RepID=UPI0020C377D7|nr:uncharacterized protein J4E78_008246 [Alternaria triticimaculans]KAI4649965.1 hypothetical protein J4E78_008246 [Alternaria triticimaculans]
MASRSSRLSSALIAASLLITSSLAQNSSEIHPSSDSCPDLNRLGDHYNYPVNGSGTANVSDLRISVTFGEFRDPDRWSRTFDAQSMVYLSAPPNSLDQTCVWFFHGVDNVRQGDDESGCDGVLPQECLDYLESELTLPDDALEQMTNGTSGRASFVCPPPHLNETEMKEICGSGFSSSMGMIGGTLNTTNMTCTVPPTGVQLPEGYHTAPLVGYGPAGVGNSSYDHELDNFTMYDEYITRPHPVVVASVANEKAKTSVVCIAPDNVLEGSRVPAESVNQPSGDGNDDESAAVGIAWGRNMDLAVLVAGVAGMSFVLA